MKSLGLDYFQNLAIERSQLFYQYLDSTGGYYQNPVQKDARSHCNIPFIFTKVDNKDKLQKLQTKFLSEAKEEGLIGLKGHASLGGFRASLYNAMPMEGVKKLISFLDKFK